QNIVLAQQGYPYFSLNFTPQGEEALIWAITRQESLFNAEAESSAGAKGLMQLLPSTAKEVARKNDLPFTPSTLSDGAANVRLGDAYINQLVRQFDGSYILAIASYNAGQGRARQWQKTYGDIGRTPEAAVDWIEGIPFSETRNYVQRVLENLQVYRTLQPKGKGNESAQLERDLLR
ncbi:MAG: lytic transglycosylase domain-containing protein, partial [Alphaproteobacteria bacterium]|nr:lytic transglycosylase domain-containing protein [Alphaproteobacteria bacterium]